jgi:ribonucleoside-diphosphate reductase alpha chain
MDTLSMQPLGRDVLRDEYAQPGETSADDVRRRIARALAEAEPQDRRDEWQARFLEAQRAGFIAAGRVASNAGTALGGATLMSCFVQPIGDSISQPEDGHPAIYTAMAEAAETLRRGGSVGYDFSRLRPRGARVASTKARAAGPVAFLRVFDAACGTLESLDARRGGQMALLRCDHPDIEVFVDAKARGELSNFNLWVGVTDAFMHAVQASAQVELVHRAPPADAGSADRRPDGMWVYRRVNAVALWQRIVRAAHEHGEPGVLFLDRVNADNNLAYCESITCANVCGEQPLPAYGACCLGSIDLTLFVVAPFRADARFDFDAFAATVPVAVRMLDNVLDVTAWPLPQQRDEALSKRRVGLGFTGLADALVMLGLHYDSDAAREAAARIARALRDAAYAASIGLARERGPFPRFDADGLLREGGFASRLPAQLQSGIREHGLRNSHLLCVAPADSISLAFADNVSAGIEPVYARSYLRHRRLRSGEVRAYEIEDYAWRVWCRTQGAAAGAGQTLPQAFVTALELTPLAQIEMVAGVAPFLDAAIAKTVNLAEHCRYEDFEPAYLRAWHRGLKGVAGVRPNRVGSGMLHAGLDAHTRRLATRG